MLNLLLCPLQGRFNLPPQGLLRLLHKNMDDYNALSNCGHIDTALNVRLLPFIRISQSAFFKMLHVRLRAPFPTCHATWIRSTMR